MALTSAIKKAQQARQVPFKCSAELELTTAGGLSVTGEYDLIYIKSVTGATVITLDDNFKGMVILSIEANAGGLTIANSAGTTIEDGTEAGTGTFAIVYDSNTTSDYRKIDFGA